MPDIKNYIKKGNKYYIYGTNILGIYCFSHITRAYGLEAVAGFIETEPEMTEYRQKSVIAVDKIRNLDDNTYIILASTYYHNEMYENLVKNGIMEEKIIVLDKLYPYFKSLECLPAGSIKRVCFWPPISSKDEILIKKISWFVPDRVEVTIWCEDDLNGLNENVRIAVPENVENIFETTDVICVWDLEKTSERLTGYENKLYAVDPNFWGIVETKNYLFLYYQSFSKEEQEYCVSQSKEQFQKLKIQNHKRRANVFCAGPSIEEIYDKEFGEDFNIAANSLVKDKVFLERIKPKLIAFIDANLYMSPNAHGLKFWEDVLEAVEKYDAHVVVYAHIKPLVVNHFPQIEDRVIGIPAVAKEIVFPETENFLILKAGNVLTSLLLPVASALCDEIGIAGCTGYGKGETGLWKYNSTMQYSELRQSVSDMWLSKYRDACPEDYYDRHCKVVEAFIKYGESCGKKYINMTTSYIPILEKRTIKEV